MAVTATTDTNEPEIETEGEAEAAAVDDVAEAHPARRWPRLVRRGLPWALIVALLGVSGFLGWQAWQQHRVDAAAHDAQEAAVHYAQVLTSIDSNNVDQNFADVLNGATGDFKDMYSQSSAQLRQLLVDNKATAHGVVIDSAVKSASPDKVVVLMFVDQTVANKAAPDPRIDRSRVRMTMEKVDGAWRASKVELP
ncbi:tetratricopeptide repeat protein [Mycobacterium sp. CVI_P3]|uniref:Tetratricopeptide repeat protein n=1 Tax=Mycobacterium pinniadriaticum TaxID=2994102 RepID=A0ABT3SKF4_9MYCO|nr:tetratricopeptide repeat protein [Mycobacterium pinniadriaticum]MCX2933561.1 tetratricopeptide repeat protein [Mycobacterium pinniadriaticum]MCX2939938.1 tetratricopeptide repeat protein [Mycobacterium pinniadriaticum]